MLPTNVPLVAARVEPFSEKATKPPSVALSPAISKGVNQVQVLFSNVIICPASSPAGSVASARGFGQCRVAVNFVCAAAADAKRNIRIATLPVRIFIRTLASLTYASRLLLLAVRGCDGRHTVAHSTHRLG